MISQHIFVFKIELQQVSQGNHQVFDRIHCYKLRLNQKLIE
jgi:hypothetical protein